MNIQNMLFRNSFVAEFTLEKFFPFGVWHDLTNQSPWLQLSTCFKHVQQIPYDYLKIMKTDYLKTKIINLFAWNMSYSTTLQSKMNIVRKDFGHVMRTSLLRQFQTFSIFEFQLTFPLLFIGINLQSQIGELWQKITFDICILFQG